MSDTSCMDRVLQGGAPASGVMLVVVLIIVSVIITGAGLNSTLVWLILAGVSILCLALCSCLKCRKRVSRWRRASSESDTISTISDGQDNFMNMMYPSALQDIPPLQRDLPPSYAAVISPDQPPPPYSALIHHLRSARNSIASMTDSESPPPYSQITAPEVVSGDYSINEEMSRQRPSITSEVESISIISNSDMNSENKYVDDTPVSNVRTFESDDRVIERNRTSSC